MEPSPFLTHIEETMYQRRYAKRTIETYALWIRRFIVYHNKRQPSTMGNQEIEQFLSHLVLERHAAPQTQALVLNALNYLYKDFLKAPLSLRLNFVKSHQPRKLPLVLTQDEMVRLIKVLPAPHSLRAALLYGCGLRLMEAVRLRVKDIDFDFSAFVYGMARAGGTGRSLWLPNSSPTFAASSPRLSSFSLWI